MNIHFANARLIDPEALAETSGASLTLGADGHIAAINAPAAPEGAQIIDCGGKALAPGIVDWGIRSNIRQGALCRTSEAAAAGGVTTLITRPDLQAPVDRPESLDHLRQAAAGLPVRMHHMAGLTEGCLGRDLAEIGLLHEAGAIAFSDGGQAIRDTRLLARAMQYAGGFGALLMGHVQDPDLSAGTVATAGKFATLYGLAAAPALAERIGLERALSLAEMTGTRFHADQITTAAALPALDRARAAGLDVSAGISIHHLTLNEFDISDYRSFFRFAPPLRPEDDRLAMVEAVADGRIDVIASFHTPLNEEAKRLPFAGAAPGAIGLETLLPAAMRLYHAGVPLARLWRAMALNPALRLGLPVGRVAVGAPGDLVLFDPDAPFILDRAKLRGSARNTPFDGWRMEGRVIGTWVAGQRVFDRNLTP